MTKHYIVWNPAKNEGFITKDKADALYVSEGIQSGFTVPTAGSLFRDTYCEDGDDALEIQEIEIPVSTKPLRLVIALDGGLITAIGSNGVHPVEIVSIDYDIEGLEVDELMGIPQHDFHYMPSEDTEEAYAFNRDGEVFFAPEWVDAVFHAVDQEDAP